MTDITASQSKQSAELLGAFRQPLLTNAHQGGPVRGDHRHAQLHHGALRPFVANLARTTCEQSGDVTFHHGAAVATGTGQLHLVRRTLPVQARLVEQVQNLFGVRLRVDGVHRLGDTDTENPSIMKRLSQGRVIDAKIPSDRVDRGRLWPADPCDSVLDLVKQGQDIAGIARIAHRDSGGKDKARRGFRQQAGLATKLGRAIALALHHWGNGGIVGIDDFTVGQLLALGQPSGLGADLLMRLLGCAQCACQALPLGCAQMGRLLEGLVCLLRQCSDGAIQFSQLRFGVAHQLHEDFALTSALATKAVHDFLQIVLECLGLALQRGRSGDTGRDELEDFF